MKFIDVVPTDLTSELQELLKEITPNFESNLKRAFKNEGLRNYRLNRSKFVYKLEDVLLPLGETIIELRNLNLPWVPDFRINQLSANLGMLYLDVNLNLGSLRVEGDYEANNSTLQEFLPISHSGKITITFHNMTAKGKVGLLIKEDSLVPVNYDISYEFTETTVGVIYYVDKDTEVENEIKKKSKDETLGRSIWPQLTGTLTELLRRQLGESVVEFSLEELLINQDDMLRERGRELSSRANRLFDGLLCSAKDFIVARGYREVITPSFDVIYKGKPSEMHLGSFHSNLGYLQELSTLTRTESLSMFEDDTQISVYGYISLREFKHGYQHYESEYDDTIIKGNIKTSIYKNKIFIKILAMKGGDDTCILILNTLQTTTIKDVDVDVCGLASLSWLSGRLRSWIIGTLRQKAIPVLEKHIAEAFNYAIDNTKCSEIMNS